MQHSVHDELQTRRTSGTVTGGFLERLIRYDVNVYIAPLLLNLKGCGEAHNPAAKNSDVTSPLPFSARSGGAPASYETI